VANLAAIVARVVASRLSAAAPERPPS
jgi:hypothetical protein